MTEMVRYQCDMPSDDALQALLAALGTIFPLDRHAVARFTGTRDSGKVELRAFMAQDRETKAALPFTIDTLRTHLLQDPLKAKPSLHGLYLTTKEGFARSIAIDIDDYTGTTLSRMPAMLEIARKRGWPLVPIRSKSGGVHLWGYIGHDTPYAVLDARTKELRDLLGLPQSTERFPKSPSVPGSQVWLPYWGACSSVGAGSVVLDAVGNPVDVVEWTRVLRHLRVPIGVVSTPIAQMTAHAVALHTPALSAPVQNADASVRVTRYTVQEDVSGSRLFPDGPPCLQTIERAGVSDFSRDATRAIATYFRLQTDDVEQVERRTTRALVVLNADVEPRVVVARSKEVDTAARGSRLGYLCKQEPLASHCNRETCVHRRFGVEATPSAERYRDQTAERLERERVKEDEKQLKLSMRQRRTMERAQQLIEALGGADVVRLTALSPSGATHGRSVGWLLRVFRDDPIEIKLAVDALLSLPKVRLALLAARKGSAAVLDGITPPVWAVVINMIDPVRETQEVAPEADPIEDIKSEFLYFFKSHPRYNTLHDVAKAGGWCSFQGHAYYRQHDMRSYLATRQVKLTAHDGRFALQELDVERRRTTRYTDDDGNSRTFQFSRIRMEFLDVQTVAEIQAKPAFVDDGLM